MKATLLSLFLLTIALSLSAQRNIQKAFNPEEFSTAIIKLTVPKSPKLVSLSFSGMDVYDKRNDSSFAGFYKTKHSRTKSFVTILKTEEATSTSVYSFLEPQISFDRQSNYRLVLLIRKLWLSKEIENTEARDHNIMMQKALLPGIITCFEFYAKQGEQLTPLLRYDTTILHHNPNLALIDEELLQTTLTSAIDKLSKTNYRQKMETGRTYSWLQVDSFSTTTSRIEILHTASFKKGVYLTYDDFKNNRPSIGDFEIKKTEFAHTLFVKDEQGNQYPTRKIWGFSDGENLFIKSADIFFKLENFNNNFYCWASKNVSMVTTVSFGDLIALGFISAATGATGGKAGRKTKAALFLKLYQLDLETGHLY
ncbi:hypothetical protein WG954_19995 [Lacibacter sp. H375]|uniref:hypothetical protein n=1 Tax=Lacibacter sp. H375 TaxID=3133424 RepID=UPI0030BA90CC